MFDFKLPDLGEGVHEGEILHWHVKAGDPVNEDDPLVEVETDKAAVTIPSPKAGKIVSISGGVGDTVAVGAVLVVIDPGEGAAASAPETPAPQAAAPAPAPVSPAPVSPAPVSPAPVSPAPQPAAPAPQPVAAAQPAVSRSGGPVPAAPATRRLARELGIDLATIHGSGPAGRVTSEDVKRAATGAAPVAAAAAPVAAVPAAAPAPAVALGPVVNDFSGGSSVPFYEVEQMPDFSTQGPIEIEQLRSIRRKVAHKMVASMVTVPHVYHMDEADVTDVDVLRKQLNAEREEGEPKLTLLAFVMKAVLSELRRRPKLNASLDPHREQIIYKKYYNLGFAADTPKGLLVPVIHGADGLSIRELGQAVRDLAGAARDGSIDVAALRGGTFTITNVGSLGGTGVVPTINYPEVAILGLGMAVEKPVVHHGAIAIRKVLPMTLAYDHRLIDGADGARFMTSLRKKLADPRRLLVEA